MSRMSARSPLTEYEVLEVADSRHISLIAWGCGDCNTIQSSITAITIVSSHQNLNSAKSFVNKHSPKLLMPACA